MNISNPLPISNIGDPYILYVKDTYYLYATSHFNGFYCWTSKDLAVWSEPVVCYEATDRSFGSSCFWAPEVYEFDGKYYIYYTAQWKLFAEENLKIGVAVADRPEGPFLDVHEEAPMFDFGYGVLDANILKDGDKNYLYYSRAGEGHVVDGAKESDLYVAELGDDFISVKGEGILIARPTQEWEKKERDVPQYWNEGSFIIKHQGRYHMMYSANFYASADYGIGAAVADHPMGPFEKYDKNPVLSTSGTISGPGHNSVVRNPEGDYFCVYHAHTDYQHPSGDRQVYIAPMWFEQGRLRVRHPEVTR